MTAPTKPEQDAYENGGLYCPHCKSDDWDCVDESNEWFYDAAADDVFEYPVGHLRCNTCESCFSDIQAEPFLHHIGVTETPWREVLKVWRADYLAHSADNPDDEDRSGCPGNRGGDHDLFYSESDGCSICALCGGTF